MMLCKHILSALAAATLAVGGVLPLAADASVVIGGTRVVYQATDGEVTVKLSNSGQAPALTQVWLDDGDVRVDPSQLDLPFILTPPISRIEPEKSQTIRIAYTGEPLPQDKEMLFWFNMLEVPPKPKAEEAGANYMQLAFRSRIKFFFRPSGLSGKPDDAPGQLIWKLGSDSGNHVLNVSNPTPYHVTIIEARVGDGDDAPRFDNGDMIAPGGRIALRLSAEVSDGSGKVGFTTLNDYGGPVKHEATLQ